MISIDHNKVDAQKYNGIVASATLSTIELKDISFVGDVSGLNGNVELAFRVGSTMLAWDYDKDVAKLSGVFQYNLQALHGDEIKIAIRAVYLVDYDVDCECDSEEGQLFLERLGKFAAYPYYRAIFASITDQAGIAMPPLPILSSLSRPIAAPMKNGPKKKKSDKKKSD